MHYYIELYYGKQTGLNNTFSQTVRDETNSSVFFTNNLFTLLRSRHIHNGDIYYLFTDVTYLSSVLTENRLLNGKQHINWNDNPVKYQLKDEFTPLATNQDRIVRYETPITATVSASTLDGVNISSPPYLSDPWYADANGNQDLGLLPVSGSKSVFKDVAYDPAFPLNPYYQIKADAVTASNGLSLSFQNWATTGTGSINTVQATIQPIKITTDNATITANYKAMLASKTTGWVGNQFASNNGTSSVMYVSDGKLWLHRENGSDMKEILVSSSISNLQNFSVTANGNNRYWVLNNGTTTLSSGHEINGIVSTSSVPALSGIPSGRVEIVRINSITPKLALVAKIGSLIFRSLGTLETNNVTWSSWTPIPAIAAPIVVAGNGNVAFVTWIETSSIKGYKLNTDGTWSVQKTITSSSSGSFTSLATAANGSNGLDLLLVRANSQTNKKDLAVSAWNADNTTLPLTVLSTSTTYGDFKAVSLSSNSGLKLASVGVSTYVPNYSYYLWKHDHTSWNQESNPFSTTEQKLFHQEVTFTPSKTTVGTLEVMTQSPVNWGGMTKVTTGSEETHVLSISGVQLTDTLIYSAHLDPSMVDSILIDTLGVWTVAVKGDGFVTETVNDLKLFGTSELVVNRDETGTHREIRFIPDLTKWDVWVVDPSGNKVRMNKSEAEKTGGEEIRELVAVYPNPFNPETRITVRLTETRELKVRVYNLVGQLVADLASGTYDRGDYAFRFDGRNLASGTYFYRVEIGNEVKTGKLQLLK
ncbi:MAG: T9SS type A sorting domain-containing protein [Bacteroidetes bacterium]|nr:T9SS type A sorting domain-containing protein [Bacteroidota bacterium]